MLSNYWKNKLEEEKNLESLQNLYKDEVMKYKLSKAAGEQYYSTIFKPITEKLVETIEPLEQLKKLSEEQSKMMLPPAVSRPLKPPVPPAIEAGEDADEFKDAIEPEDEGAVDGVVETRREIKISKVTKFNIDKGLDIDDIRLRGFKPPSEYIGKNDDEIEKAIRDVGDGKNSKRIITKEIKNLEGDIESLQEAHGESSEIVTRYRILIKIEEKTLEKEHLEKKYKHLENLTAALQKLKGEQQFIDEEEEEKKEGKGLYKIKRNGQYGSSYIDIPLLKKRRILRVVDGFGNPLLNGKMSKDFVDLITKRFNSKKKYKGSSIEAFKLLNKLSSMPTNKRSKKVVTCRPTFYDDPKDLIDHLDLILGSIEAGNNNLKNEGIAVHDELLKIGAIGGKGHERIYKRFLT